ncbi:hypothetical protein COV19_07600 [Candidatus Woesearchaeota archaeon CG10_big_fil_rev_8_21_14_0_10_44_13]|nr:MAG: hypothetical protein COV19_07600 [Candidatus Woesearchaeota archaeon CG10_big_fil_rev_8_21_14_0_10_44_13]
MKKKIKEWLKRYVPAEIFATIGVVIGSWLVFVLTGNRVLSAYIGTIGENIGFYSFIFIREHINDFNHSKRKKRDHGLKGFLKTTRNLIFEFGVSETLDSLFFRPFCIYIFPILIGNYLTGILVGKIVADIIFYIPTIIAYELKKKHLV